MQPQLIDNLNVRLADDFKEQIKPVSREAIVAACFSIFAFHELKQQLNQVEEVRFIFNSPAFTTDSLQQEEPVFRLERQQQERSLHGTAFELQLYINLKARVESRMKIVNLAATGDENLLSPEEKIDLEYRKQQLQRLKDEVVDMEDMQSGIFITDLGLNDFRMDLVDYVKRNPDLEQAPLGLYAVAPVRGDA